MLQSVRRKQHSGSNDRFTREKPFTLGLEGKWEFSKQGGWDRVLSGAQSSDKLAGMRRPAELRNSRHQVGNCPRAGEERTRTNRGLAEK